MRLDPADTEKAKRGELVCHGCFSHQVSKVCGFCGHYFCLDCYGAEDHCIWCEAKFEEEKMGGA